MTTARVNMARGIGCRKAVGLMRRGVETGAKRADKEKPERARQHGGAGDETG